MLIDYQSNNQSFIIIIYHYYYLAIITLGKNTENTISTNGRYNQPNQAETALIVDLETQNNKSITIMQQWIIN